jgi:Uma2 family endonuclease
MVGDPTTTQAQRITGEELAALGDIGPCELVEGSIVPMSPTGFEHGEVELAIGSEIRAFARAHNLGRTMSGEVGIYTRRSPDTVRAADVVFISHERHAQRTSDGYLDVAPDLVVEVLSPTNRWSETMQKLREYFSIGVRLVWVVDTAARSVFAYRALTDVREFASENDLPGEDVLPGFVLPVARLFDDV